MGAMNEPETYWPMNSKVESGDLIFIYLAAPYKQIAYICEVLKTGLNENDIIKFVKPFFVTPVECDKKSKDFMKIKPVQTLPLSPDSLFALQSLKENGLKGMLMGPRKLDNCPPLLEYAKGALL